MLTASAEVKVRDISENETQTDLELEPRLFEYVMTYCDVFSNLLGDRYSILELTRGNKRLRMARLFPLGPDKSLAGV